MTSVEFDELETAVTLVGGDERLGASARISRGTGQVFVRDEESVAEACLPEDPDDDER